MSLESSLRRIFEEALDREDPAERSRYLDAACETDSTLRARVERLLQAHNSAGRFLAESESGIRARRWTGTTLELEQPGQKIGRYKLLEQIGEGGCGRVYMAEQEEPVRRRVALKIIKLGMDTRSVIARFEAERQALAMMDHPNIARVFDAGATETGRPYFVMELVRGVKITDYCDQNSLTTDERLRLFVQVCRAVQHAHQKGIIHRDIKPGNILVTLHDGVPVPKVIDFGIAKATGQERLTDQTLFTSFQQFIGTPVYMSPEQAEMSGLDIDTRSDIYSLGVLLYELLTGRTPFDPKELLAAGLDGMRKTIREQEPALPSTRFQRMQEKELTTVAKQRQTAPLRLLTMLRGDLDWVVMKCLEKDRARRYGTAIEVALEVERYLRNEPVTARPATWLYQLRKLVRRKKMALAASAAVAVALIMGTSLSTWLYFRERSALGMAADNARKAGEQARAAEQTVTRLEIQQAESLFSADDSSTALAYLARVLRREPTNRVVAERLLSALGNRAFCLPVARIEHTKSLTVAVFSPDGRRVLTASRDGRLKISDGSTGAVIHEVQGHNDEILAATWSSNGAFLASGSKDKTVRIWNPETGVQAGPPLIHTAPVVSLRFNSDGRFLATGTADGSARVWNSPAGQAITPDLPHRGRINEIAFAPDAQTLITASSDYYARIWDLASGKLRHQPIHVGHEVLFCEASPDGKRFLAGGRNQYLLIWDLELTNRVHEAVHVGTTLVSGKFSPDGRRILTAAQDGTARVLEASTGRLLFSIKHARALSSAEFTPDGTRIVTASYDRTARVYDAETGQPVTEPIQHWSEVYSAAMRRDGQRLLTRQAGNRAFLWDLRIATQGIPFEHLNHVTVGRFSADGTKAITASKDGYAYVWDISAGRRIAQALRSKVWILDAAFSPDGKSFVTTTVGSSTSRTAMARIWNAANGSPQTEMLKHPAHVYSARFSPDGEWLLTVCHGPFAQIWNARSGEAVSPRIAHGVSTNFSGTARFSPDTRAILTTGQDNYARIWNVPDGTPKLQLKHNARVISASYSPDGSMVATGCKDNTAYFWILKTGKPLLPPLAHAESVHDVTFSPDGTRLVTTSGDAIRVWDVKTGMAETLPLKHPGSVGSTRLSPDGRRIATACADGNVRIWDAQTGHNLSEPLHHEGALTSCEWSPDGNWLLSCSEDGTARLWEIARVDGAAPAWLSNLAEALAGQRFEKNNRLKALGVAENLQMRETLRNISTNQPLEEWARWFISESFTRSVSPRSEILAGENARALQAQKRLRAATEYVRLERWNDAIEHYSRALSLSSAPAMIYVRRANIRAEIGDFEHAREDLLKAIELEPDNARAINDLAWYLCNYFKEPNSALPLAQRAVQLTKDNSDYLNTLGIIYYRLGLFDQALETLQAAKSAFLEGTAPALDDFFLAMTHFQLGGRAEAERCFEEGFKWLKGNSIWLSGLTKMEIELFHQEAKLLLGTSEQR